MPSPRVISLVPSATEILCLIGAQDLLVARSHECDFPQGLAHLPALTGPATSGVDPAAIDRQVREALASGASLYHLDTDRLRALKPDLVLTQDMCEVCSIDLASVRAAADSCTPPARILSLNPHSVEDVLDDILRVGEAVDRVPAARKAVVDLRARFFTAQEYVNPYSQAPTVGFLEWTDPLFCAGHWSVQLIERAGGLHPWNPTVPRPNAGDAAGPQQGERVAGKSVRVPPEVFAAMRPEYLIIAPCGVELSVAQQHARALAEQPWWVDLPAVRDGRVAVVDGNQMFNRPGPRLADAFEWMVGFLNDRLDLMPRDFPWIRLPPQA